MIIDYFLYCRSVTLLLIFCPSPFLLPSLWTRRVQRGALGECFQSSEWQSSSYSRRTKFESVPSPASCCQYCPGGIYFSSWLQNAWLTPCTCHICSDACSLYLFTFWQKFAVHVGALGSHVHSRSSVLVKEVGNLTPHPHLPNPGHHLHIPALLFPFSASWWIPSFPSTFRLGITSTNKLSLMFSCWIRCLSSDIQRISFIPLPIASPSMPST